MEYDKSRCCRDVVYLEHSNFYCCTCKTGQGDEFYRNNKDRDGLSAIEIQRHKETIDGMSRLAMCELHRYAQPGHLYFVRGSELGDYWQKRFKGFTPQISKQIGWDKR